MNKVFTLLIEGSMKVDEKRPWLFRCKLKWCPACNEQHWVTLTTDMKKFQCFQEENHPYRSIYTGEKVT